MDDRLYHIAIDTSSVMCSVAVGCDEKVVYAAELHANRSHAERLPDMILSALRACQIRFEDIHAIAISAGPGSYTGLRISTSTAKGICTALELPLLVIDTPACIAAQCLPFLNEGDEIVSVLHARKNEFFAGYFLYTNLRLIQISETTLLDKDDLFSSDDEAGTGSVGGDSLIWLVGPGSHTILGDGANGPGNVRYLPSLLTRPSASGVLKALYHNSDLARQVDVGEFEPAYLRKFKPGKARKNPFSIVPVKSQNK